MATIDAAAASVATRIPPAVQSLLAFLEKHPDEVFFTQELVQRTRISARDVNRLGAAFPRHKTIIKHKSVWGVPASLKKLKKRLGIL